MSNDNKVIRKLRAILSADVKGYSLLMADDEIHTIETLKKYRNLMSDLIYQHSGRVVDNPGDNLLAEFSSAVDAVECAVEVHPTVLIIVSQIKTINASLKLLDSQCLPYI
jgi:class 3 adenylate cyclase